MRKTVLEIVGGRIKRGNRLPQRDYEKFKPLFEALEKYIKRIRVDGYEIIIIGTIPPDVLLSLPPDLQALYQELLSLASGPYSPIVHLPRCQIIIT